MNDALMYRVTYSFTTTEVNMLVNNIKAALLVNFNKVNKLKPYLTLEGTLWLNNEVWLQGDCNSRVTVVARDSNTDFYGQKVIYYKRRLITEDLVGLKIPGKRSDYTGLKSVIKALHDKCGVPLDKDEFLDSVIPTTGPVTIQPTTQCMAYLPSAAITLEFAET